MKLPVIRHEDDRRVLTEFISDIPFKRAKVIEAKEECMLGNHYHFNNDSVFYMMSGKSYFSLKNLQGKLIEEGELVPGDCLFVHRGVIHTFRAEKGSILIETASEPFDKNDEIQATV